MSGKDTLRIRTIEVAGAAIFGGGSAAVAFITAPYLPRLAGWGIAFIDPVSILWVACYLVFGVRSGFMAAIIGTIALMPVDPFAPIGPLMKLAATLPMILVSRLLLSLVSRGHGANPSKLSLKLTTPGTYIICMASATAIRDVVMIVVNILLFVYVFGPIFPWEFIIVTAALINTEQSIWDTLIPWIALRPTKVLAKYGIW